MEGRASEFDASVALLIFLLAWAHGLLWATLVPLWQAPDEPLHYEYARLLAEIGRPPGLGDRSPQLQAEILGSLAANRFWEYLGDSTPDPPPVTFAETTDFWLSRAGTQIADEPPLYYLLPAVICRWLLGIECQLRAMRAYSTALSAGVVVLGWLAAREFWPDSRRLPLVAAIWLGFHPMATFIGASVNNDVLVNLGGAGLAFTLVRGSRRGWSKRSLAALIAMTVLLPLSKKSGFFALPLVAIVLILIMRQRLPSRWLWAGLLPICVAVLTLAGLSLGPMEQQAAAWERRTASRSESRTAIAAHSGAWSLTLPASQAGQQGWLMQALPHSQARRLRGQEVILRLWAQTTEEAQVQITVDDGQDSLTHWVTLGPRWQFFQLRYHMAADADRLQVILAGVSTEGGLPAFFFDDLSLQSSAGELLRNGSAEAPRRRWEHWMATCLRLPSWFARGLFDPASYDTASVQRYAFYGLVTLGNFWADFGWLTLPLPLWAYALIGLAILASACGLRWVEELLPEQWQRGALLLLGIQAVLVVVVTFLPMVGRDWQPQGRYLFPALVPWALLFALGWYGLGVRLGWRRWHLALALGMILLDAGSLLGVVVPHYY